ncbi:MAG: hypothetical protein WB696_21765, partial [Chthoniobacterales bacterium]
ITHHWTTCNLQAGALPSARNRRFRFEELVLSQKLASKAMITAAGRDENNQARKGFDGGFGKKTSLITSRGNLISLPIPEKKPVGHPIS